MSPSARQKLTGFAYFVTALLLFSALDTCAKIAARDLPLLQVVWFRYAVHFVIFGLVMNPWTSPRAWQVRRPVAQAVRAGFLCICTALNFLALQYLQLSQTVTIQFLAPLMIAIFSVIFLGERVGPRRWVAIAIGFAGILVVTRPGIAAVHWAVLLSIGSVASYAGYVILTRLLTGTETARSLLLVSAGIPTLVGLPLLPFIWQTPPDAGTWLLLIGIGTLGGAGHGLLIAAHRHVEASAIAPLGYIQLLPMIAFGFAVFGDVPSVWTLAGAAIVIASGLYFLSRERHTGKAEPEAAGGSPPVVH